MSDSASASSLLLSRLDSASSIPSNLSIAHRSEGGLHPLRGVGTYIYDQDGRPYLDCVNNVTHVGHANAEVNRRMAEQQNRINTNTVQQHTTQALLHDKHSYAPHACSFSLLSFFLFSLSVTLVPLFLPILVAFCLSFPPPSPPVPPSSSRRDPRRMTSLSEYVEHTHKRGERR